MALKFLDFQTMSKADFSQFSRVLIFLDDSDGLHADVEAHVFSDDTLCNWFLPLLKRRLLEGFGRNLLWLRVRRHKGFKLWLIISNRSWSWSISSRKSGGINSEEFAKVESILILSPRPWLLAHKYVLMKFVVHRGSSLVVHFIKFKQLCLLFQLKPTIGPFLISHFFYIDIHLILNHWVF